MVWQKKAPKITISAPSHNFVGLYLSVLFLDSIDAADDDIIKTDDEGNKPTTTVSEQVS